MNMSVWGIRQPVPVIVIFVALTLAGILGFQRLGIQNFPDVDLPVVTVTVNYPGVPPAQLETEITRRVEDAVATITGVKHIRSTVNTGVSVSAVEFQLEKDLSEAVDEVRDAVTRIRNVLPADANEPIIGRINTAGLPILTYSVQAEGLSDVELSWLVDRTVTRELTSISGVGSITRVGGVDREVLVELDPDRMAALGVTASDVSRQLRRTQAELPGGEARLGGREQTVRADATVRSAAELGALTIPLPAVNGGNGRSVRLDQIATIRDRAAEARQLALLDGKPVIGFEVTRARGASEVAVAEGVRGRLAGLAQANPNLQFVQVSSTVDYVREQYEDSIKILIEGAILAVVVVWFFLRDWRATFISAVALPLSILPAFSAMYYFGSTLNTVTLLALSLVIGILVDDAIVEVENIVRHLRMGKPPLKAAEDAATEIGLAVIATTLTLCAVFIPVAFMGGIPGRYFRHFGFAATAAILFSLLVARLLTPMMAAYMMKAHDERPPGRLSHRYLWLVRACLHHRVITMVTALALFAGSIALVPLLPKGFIPAGDVGYTIVTLELPPGATLEDTRRTAEAARARMSDVPGIQRVFTAIGATTFAGSGGLTALGEVRRASLTLTLKPRDERTASQQDVEREALARLRQLPGVRVSLATGSPGEKLEVALVGDDGRALQAAAAAVARDLLTVPGLGSVGSSASLLRPEILVRPIPERAADLGVSSDTIADAVRIATAGDIAQSLPKLNLPERQVPIRVRFAESARVDLDRIRSLQVPSRTGTVPLEAVATVELGAGPAQIDRYDRQRNITIDATLQGQPLGEVMEVVDKLPSLATVPAGVKRVEAGDAEIMNELFGSFGLAMGVGVLCIYAVLVLLFHDFLQPVTILTALPLSAGGAFGLLLLFGHSLSMPALIGLLMLMGIVTKNSILLVEYAIVARRERGLDREAAMLDACAKRARPIVMTTIAMAAGMAPVAAGFTSDPSFRAPMAIAVIGGLITSTALSLFVVPVVYTYVDDVERLLGRIFRRRRHVQAAQPGA